MWKKVAKRNSSKKETRRKESKGSGLVATKPMPLPFVSEKLVEFEKGKTAIAVLSTGKLPTVIDTLIAAVRNGELDAQLAAASTKPHKKAAKK